ncbi:MAG: sulfite exporter TauE/SafE family protein [Gemmatimonadales bacterium]
MELTLQYWFMFPISILIAAIAMSTGVGGAVFFSPIFMLALKIEPAVAIGTALITELFGFTSGVYAYTRQRLIDFKLGLMLLAFSVPAAVVGSLTAESFPPNALKSIFAAGVIFIGWQLFRSLRHAQVDPAGENPDAHTSRLVDRSGREFHYTVCNKGQGMSFAAVGGWFLGMISVGLAELQEYHLVVRCRIPPPVAVGTAIFVVVVSVLVASLGHFYNFAFRSEPEVLHQVLGLVAFTVPGVIVGGQIGPLLQAKLDPDHIKMGLSVIFVAVGVFMLAMVMA